MRVVSPAARNLVLTPACVFVSSVHAVEVPLVAFDTLVRGLPAGNIEQHRPVFQAAVTSLRGMMTVTGPYERPTRSRALHPFVQRDFPEIRRDKLKGKILSRNEFAQAAAQRPSPLAELDKAAAASLDQDLKAAIDHHVAEHDAVPAQREERLRVLRKVADSLGPLRATLDACKCETARLIAADFNAAWVAALIDAMQWPDVRMPLLYIIGFPVVFDIPDSGVFRADYQPAEIPPEEFMRANTRVVTAITDEIERSAKQGDAEQLERRQQC